MSVSQTSFHQTSVIQFWKEAWALFRASPTGIAQLSLGNFGILTISLATYRRYYSEVIPDGFLILFWMAIALFIFNYIIFSFLNGAILALYSNETVKLCSLSLGTVFRASVVSFISVFLVDVDQFRRIEFLDARVALLMLLSVLGVYLYVVWSQAFILVIDGKARCLDSFTMSARLTRGARGKFFLTQFGIGIPLLFLFFLLEGWWDIGEEFISLWEFLLFVFLFLGASLMLAYMTLLSAVLYQRLQGRERCQERKG